MSRQPSKSSPNQPSGADGHAKDEEGDEPKRNGGGVRCAFLAAYFP